jgi:hypothetical protein
MPILRSLLEVMTLSEGNDRLDYNVVHINAVSLVGRV